jgi:hypothetical protein
MDNSRKQARLDLASSLCHHLDDMTDLDKAVARAVAKAPGSIRELSRDAGIDQSLLIRIINGERRASPETAAKLNAALRDWVNRCGEAVIVIENATNKRREKNG